MTVLKAAAAVLEAVAKVLAGLGFVLAVLIGLIVALLLGEWIYLRLTAVDRQPYVRDNERILNSLPVFPARELARRSAGYHAENGVLGAFDRTIGYDTGVDYAIPKGTRRAQVIRFYVDHMRGWKLGDANYRDGIVDFTRGKGVRGRRRLGGGNDGLGPTLEGRSQRRQARRRAAIDGAVGSCG
jgi:hypothetical protein